MEGTVLCQNLGGGQKCQVENANKEQKISNNVSSKAQLMSTLFGVAAANGVSPDLLPVIQPSLPNDKPQYQCVKDVPRSLNLIQLPQNTYQGPKESVIVTGNSVNSVSQPSQPVFVSSPPVMSSSQSYIPSMYSYIPSPQVNVYPGPQTIRLENTPCSYPNTASIQTIPATWQSQAYMSEIPRETPGNPQIISTIPTLQEEEDSASIEEITPASRVVSCVEIPNECKSSLPVNLQINLPSQNIPAPKITVVSAAPASPPTVPTSPYGQSSYPFPPYFPPPIIVDKSDSLNSWLPMILIALFANDRGNCGGGCGCTCCCPCSNSNSAIPVPYPIPMPINNPIINTSRGSKAKFSKSKMQTSVCNKDNDDEEDDDDNDSKEEHN
ncbi:unnamed protein product [Colias eurytheme]|nr:unnamed protein product [Colias eurytheme]